VGEEEDEGLVIGGLSRSFKKKIKEKEMREDDEKEVMRGVSIEERLDEIKKSGDKEWKKRMKKINKII
jgi:hypothetical protein